MFRTKLNLVNINIMVEGYDQRGSDLQFVTRFDVSHGIECPYRVQVLSNSKMLYCLLVNTIEHIHIRLFTLKKDKQTNQQKKDILLKLNPCAPVSDLLAACSWAMVLLSFTWIFNKPTYQVILIVACHY